MEMSNFWKTQYFIIWFIVQACNESEEMRPDVCSSVTAVMNEQIPSTDEDHVMRLPYL